MYSQNKSLSSHRLKVAVTALCVVGVCAAFMLFDFMVNVSQAEAAQTIAERSEQR